MPKKSYAEAVAANRATADRASWIEREALRHQIGASPRVVEIGAGAGWNLARLPATWFRVGYDVDQEFLEIGRASLGLDLRYGFVDEALADLATADLVLLSHVVEHFSDPGAVLERIGKHLAPGALLLIEVPGVFRIHRTNLDVRSYLQNAHTFTYCAATLQDLCRRAGLEVLNLDETARAVCRTGGGVQRKGTVRRDLPERIIRYLRRCDTGYRRYTALYGLPGVGRAAAFAWRRYFSAAVGRTTTSSMR